MRGVYAAFGTAWGDTEGADARLQGLAEESIFLARLLVALLPGEPETYGLLALLLFAHSRRFARRTADGVYVPLEEQNLALWSAAEIDEAERMLVAAFPLGRIGPFQLEAALQSAHVNGARRGRLDHDAVLALYDGLVAMAPSLGALVGRAAALLEGRGAEVALAALDAIAAEAKEYQPWWAVRAAALRRAGRHAEAQDAYARASGMTEDDAVRRFLAAQSAELRGAEAPRT